LWVDGSFVTDKLNPDDVDLAFVISAAAFRSMDIRQRQFFDWFRATSLKGQYKCDNYCFVHDEVVPEAEWLRAYWLRQFGFSRASEMKGLAVVKVPFVVMP